MYGYFIIILWMKSIVSVSRRTDIPAFYGNWFKNRLDQGYAGYIHPYSMEKFVLPLTPDTVVCFVFWSKNFLPFTEYLAETRLKGFHFYFNYTITGLPECFEPNLPEKNRLLDNMKLLSDTYSPETINWRYDPVIISNKTDASYHIHQFKTMAALLKGYVKRCYFSFMQSYNKIKTTIQGLEKTHDLFVVDPPVEEKIKLVSALQDIADENGMTLYSCCDTRLVNERIKIAHCIDGELIQKLFSVKDFPFEPGPTRKSCGCTKSYDIGIYDSCPHGCLYCYANTAPDIVHRTYTHHDPLSPFLGYPKKTAEKWVHEMKAV